MSVKPRYVRETPNMWGYSAQPTTLLYKKDGVCSKLVVDIDAYREGQSEGFCRKNEASWYDHLHHLATCRHRWTNNDQFQRKALSKGHPVVLSQS